MAILSEDIDFPNGVPVGVTTTGGRFRAGYPRCAIYGGGTSGSIGKSRLFEGGAVTSCWLSFYAYANNIGGTTRMVVGLGRSGTNSGLFIGESTSANNRVGLFKFDGTTPTQLAQETGTTISANQFVRFDIQLVNYGATATVNVYANGVLIIPYTGDVTVSGVTDVDSIFLYTTAAEVFDLSEFIVASEDTRTFSENNAAPAALGTTHEWTGAASDVNEITNNDSTAIYVNVNGKNEQFTLTGPPAGVFSVNGVTITARASKTADSAIGKIGLGWLIGGVIYPGTLQSLTTAWATYSEFWATNPATGVAWTLADLAAAQINIQSGT